MSLFIGKRRSSRFRDYLKAFLLAFGLMQAPLSQAYDKITYYHLDALGSPVAATDETGTVVWREDYRPYGDRIQKQPEAALNTRWYTGHPNEEVTGLTYMGARWYDPVVGRFMAVDPKNFDEKDASTFNRYRYAADNPYKFIDNNGAYDIYAQYINIGDKNEYRFSFTFYTSKAQIYGRDYGKSFTKADRIAKIVEWAFGQQGTGVSDEAHPLLSNMRKEMDKLDPTFEKMFVDKFGDRNAKITEEQAKEFLWETRRANREKAWMYPKPDSLIERAKERSKSTPKEWAKDLAK